MIIASLAGMFDTLSRAFSPPTGAGNCRATPRDTRGIG
jgi:hypothetical protein